MIKMKSALVRLSCSLKQVIVNILSTFFLSTFLETFLFLVFKNHSNFLSVQFISINYMPIVVQWTARVFHLLKLKLYAHWRVPPLLVSTFPSLLIPPSYFVSLSLTTLDISFKWNHTVWLFFFLCFLGDCPVSLSIMSSGFYPCCSIW